jgi:hypothetical protein
VVPEKDPVPASDQLSKNSPEVVEISLKAALRDADAGKLGFVPEGVPAGVVLKLPLSVVGPQLAMGRVEIGLEELRQGVQEANRRAFDGATADLRVVVPLSELFPLLPAELIPGAGGIPEPLSENPGQTGEERHRQMDDDDDEEFLPEFPQPSAAVSAAAASLPKENAVLKPAPSMAAPTGAVLKPLPSLAVAARSPLPMSVAAPAAVPAPPPVLAPLIAGAVPKPASMPAPIASPAPVEPEAPVSLPSAISGLPALPPLPAVSGGIPAIPENLPALPPLVLRNGGMFSRPPARPVAAAPVANQGLGSAPGLASIGPVTPPPRNASSSGIAPLPLLSRGPSLSPMPPVPKIHAGEMDPPPSPAPPPASPVGPVSPVVPVGQAGPVPPPTLTVLTDCRDLPGEDDDLGPDRPAGALMLEPPFPGQKPAVPDSAPRPLPVPPLEPILKPAEAEPVMPTAKSEPEPQPEAELEAHTRTSNPEPLAVASQIPPASPTLPILPSLPALIPVLAPLTPPAEETAAQPTTPTLAPIVPPTGPEPETSPQLPDDGEDVAFGCVPDATQLTLRALFGTSDWLTSQEVVNRCSRLPGLRACVLLRPPAPALSSDGLTEADSETFVRQAARTFEFLLDLSGPDTDPGAKPAPLPGDAPAPNSSSADSAPGSGSPAAGTPRSANFTLRSDDSVRSFFIAGDCCLAVWHQEAAFSSGTREKLILTAGELARTGLNPEVQTGNSKPETRNPES